MSHIVYYYVLVCVLNSCRSTARKQLGVVKQAGVASYVPVTINAEATFSLAPSNHCMRGHEASFRAHPQTIWSLFTLIPVHFFTRFFCSVTFNSDFTWCQFHSCTSYCNYVQCTVSFILYIVNIGLFNSFIIISRLLWLLGVVVIWCWKESVLHFSFCDIKRQSHVFACSLKRSKVRFSQRWVTQLRIRSAAGCQWLNVLEANRWW